MDRRFLTRSEVRRYSRRAAVMAAGIIGMAEKQNGGALLAAAVSPKAR
jgi:hypothetical protein